MIKIAKKHWKLRRNLLQTAVKWRKLIKNHFKNAENCAKLILNKKKCWKSSKIWLKFEENEQNVKKIDEKLQKKIVKKWAKFYSNCEKNVEIHQKLEKIRQKMKKYTTLIEIREKMLKNEWNLLKILGKSVKNL